ncbi:MAG: RICIN domain-containing protein, partial [Lachnospiraceae bacterium]|nr:RICIN domain-containing protein [Lachnospiraceae bacterium]
AKYSYTHGSSGSSGSGSNNSGSASSTASGDVYIYQDINYGGRSASLGVGKFNLAALQAKGFRNDDLTAIKCPWGYKVTLYADDNFSGASKVITADTSWIGSDWNDRTSSIKVEKAKYRIVNRHSGLCLDVSGGSSANGANVQQWTANGIAAQTWEVNFNSDDSTYVITSTINGKAVDMDGWSKDNGGNAIMWDNNKTNNQRWYITYVGDGYSFLINKDSNKCLEVGGWSTSAGGNVQQWDYFAQANQQWKFEMVN